MDVRKGKGPAIETSGAQIETQESAVPKNIVKVKEGGSKEKR